MSQIRSAYTMQNVIIVCLGVLKIFKQLYSRPLLIEIIPLRAGSSRTRDIKANIPVFSGSNGDLKRQTIEIFSGLASFRAERYLESRFNVVVLSRVRGI